jgi:hypothetical protein
MELPLSETPVDFYEPRIPPEQENPFLSLHVRPVSGDGGYINSPLPPSFSLSPLTQGETFFQNGHGSAQWRWSLALPKTAQDLRDVSLLLSGFSTKSTPYSKIYLLNGSGFHCNLHDQSFFPKL